MDVNWQQRYYDVINDCNESLIGMALDPRLMPGVASILPSTASTPSLRARESSVAPVGGGKMDGPGGNVRVVVRVRGFLPREIQRGAQCLVEMNPITQETKLLPPIDNDPANARMKSRKVIEKKSFTFDKSFCSHDKSDPNYATQDKVYNSLGEEFLDHNFEGYHTCIFAYGQTGSGKSYTMMGTPENPGLIPRTCQDLFARIEGAKVANVQYDVRVSYFEVYNEHVRDLLTPVTQQKGTCYLKIRESPTNGPYIKDLTDVKVKNIDQIMEHIKNGDANRTTASTKMNDTSSRSHAVFTIMLKQIHHSMVTDETTERLARIRLVDLAGSERAKATEATGARLREGSNINKSLTTLGRVIAALADPKHGRGKRNKDVVPYRDSILTWLLKDSLGGNSKTAMIACIAPSDYDETLSTLRYADQAKHIRTSAIINQDHISAAERDAQIEAMAETIARLQKTLNDKVQNDNAASKPMTKAEKEMEEKNEELQATILNLSRLQEEKAMVHESKIRALHTENEALKLHLKLALDTIKHPIPDIKPTVECVSCGSDPYTGELNNIHEGTYEDKENIIDVDEGLGMSEDGHEYQALETQNFLKEFLKDVRMFKKKVGDDKSRWIPSDKANPLGERHNV